MNNQNDQSQKQLPTLEGVEILEDKSLENVTGGILRCFSCFSAPKTTDPTPIGGPPKPLTYDQGIHDIPLPLPDSPAITPPATPAHRPGPMPK
jgi:hypothetical protein